MGQKTNPNIFRLGINKTWKTEFFEKKQHELPLYSFKDLEIQNYIERFLDTHGILLHDYKQHYNNSTLSLYVSCFITTNFLAQSKKMSENIVVLNGSNQKSVKIKSQICEKSNCDSNIQKPDLDDISKKNLYKMKEYFMKYSSNNTMLKSNTSSDISSVKIEGIFNNMLKVLNLFTNNTCNIVLNLSCLNKDLTYLKGLKKKTFVSLQKFRGTPFLKEGAELLFCVTHSNGSARLLAKFITIQLKKTKRHKFFFTFLKQTLTILLESTLSKVKGIKIMVKGRINGVPRAKHKTITIGDVPTQSLDANIDYCQLTTQNSSGSFGISVWVVER